MSCYHFTWWCLQTRNSFWFETDGAWQTT